jgi:RimJ/RimL family protein N-acetyltransferase
MAQGTGDELGFCLRPTRVADLDFVLQAEQDSQNRAWIIPWLRETHQQTLGSPNLAHLIVQDVQNERSVGFVILAGLLDDNQAIEFRRIVITEKGQGYGKRAIELVKQLAFETYHAHRLWLDVKVENDRARAIYQVAGFVEEGILRECLKSDTGYESLVIMSMLRQEYRKQEDSA